MNGLGVWIVQLMSSLKIIFICMALIIVVLGVFLIIERNELKEKCTSNNAITPNDENKNADLFQAAKVSLGSLGAITELTIQNTKNCIKWTSDVSCPKC